MNLTREIALQLMPVSDGQTKIRFQDGFTDDIIQVLLSDYRKSYWQTEAIASYFKGGNLLPVLERIHGWVRKNIQYRLDPEGEQLIPTPSRALNQGFADCKGLAVFTASVLTNLKIENSIRFVSYDQGHKITHVYNVVHHPTGDYILDTCLPAFNSEKKFTHKIDFHVSRIMSISGPSEEEISGPAISDNETESSYELKLMRETVQQERAIAGQIAGIGSLVYKNLDQAVGEYDRAVSYLNGPYPERAIAGIGDGIGRRSRADRKASRKARRKRVFKKLATGVKKGVKLVKKIALAPARLGIRIILPKLAPLFLYLFIIDPRAIAALPAKAQRKRKRAVTLSKFIVNGLGMKESLFMRIVRNGIMKKYKRTPEQILSGSMSKVSGIGVVAEANVILSLLDKLFKIIGKKPEGGASADDVPNPEEDFEGMSTSELRKVKTHVRNKTATQRGEEPNDLAEEMDDQANHDNVMDKVENEPEDTPVDEPLPEADENFNQPLAKSGSATKGKKSGTTSTDEDDNDGPNPGNQFGDLFKNPIVIGLGSFFAGRLTK